MMMKGIPKKWKLLLAIGFVLVLVGIVATTIVAAMLTATPIAVVEPIATHLIDPSVLESFQESNHHADSSDTEKDDNVYSIVIVGAGAAGLFAGYTLDYLGIRDFVILEANNDVGGRTREVPLDFDFADVPLDLGAEWIHVHSQVLKDLLYYQLDKEDVAMNYPTIEYRPRSVYASRYNLGRGKQRYQKLFLHQYFYKEHKFYNTTWGSYLRNYVYWHIQENVETNAEVVSIDYSLSSSMGVVSITTNDGRTVYGSKVIVATPAASIELRNDKKTENGITFVPPLSKAKRDALSKIHTAEGLKAWLEFDERFYPDLLYVDNFKERYRNDNDDDNDDNGAYSDNDNVFDVDNTNDDYDHDDSTNDNYGESAHFYGDEYFYFDALFQKSSKKNILALFAVGMEIEPNNLFFLSDDKLLKHLLRELDEIFDNKASMHFVRGLVQNWSQEPYARGAYSYNWLNEPTKETLQESIDSRLYFCGEYLHKKYQSTVHGAAMSGRDVVLQLLEETTVA